MPRRPVENKRKTFGFSLDPGVEERARRYAEREDKLVSRVVERAITEYLDREEGRLQKPAESED